MNNPCNCIQTICKIQFSTQLANYIVHPSPQVGRRGQEYFNLINLHEGTRLQMCAWDLNSLYFYLSQSHYLVLYKSSWWYGGFGVRQGVHYWLPALKEPFV